MDKVLITGATGFVGGALYPALIAQRCRVRCASRNPGRASALHPERDWVQLDVERRETLRPALTGCDTAYYLVHGMSDAEAGDYEQREERAAREFAQAAS